MTRTTPEHLAELLAVAADAAEELGRNVLASALRRGAAALDGSDYEVMAALMAETRVAVFGGRRSGKTEAQQRVADSMRYWYERGFWSPDR